MNASTLKTTTAFEDRTVRHFVIAFIVRGFVGMLAGLSAPMQLGFW